MSTSCEVHQGERLAVLRIALDVDASKNPCHVTDSHVAAFGLDRRLRVESKVVRQYPPLGQVLDDLDETRAWLKTFEACKRVVLEKAS